MKEVPTHVAPPQDMSKVSCRGRGKHLMTLPDAHDAVVIFVQDAYVALNKPKSVDHWLQNAKVAHNLSADFALA